MRFMDWTVALYTLIPIFLIAGLVQYILLRMRNAQAEHHDPQLGRKYLICFFLNIAIVLITVGMSISAVDFADYAFEPLIEKQEAKKDAEMARERGEDAPVQVAVPKSPRVWFNDKQRTAAGLVASGLLYVVLFWPVLRFGTNARQFPSAGRAFVGMRFLISMLIMMTLTTIVMIGVFQKGDTELHSASIVTGLGMVWGTSALLHLVALLLSRGWHRGNKEREESGE